MTVNDCLIHFVTLAVVTDLGSMYYHAQMDNSLKVLFKQPIVRKVRGKDIKFSDRRCFHKIARIIYKMFRALYVSYIFYLVPFTSVLISFAIGYPYNWTYNDNARDDWI